MTEKDIQNGFIKAVNKLVVIRKEVIDNLREVQSELGGTDDFVTEVIRLENERNVAAELVQQLIDQNARAAKDQADYQQRYDDLFKRYEDAEQALATAQESRRQKEKKNEQIEDFISEIEKLPDSITEFCPDYWGHLVEKLTVYRNRKMTYTFACGVEIQV